jgi:hypothetical protein
MNLDEWVLMAQDRLREAAREVEKRPELKEEFEFFLSLLRLKARKSEYSTICYYSESKNPVSDILSFDDLSNTLENAFLFSDIDQRNRFSLGDWVS